MIDTKNNYNIPKIYVKDIHLTNTSKEDVNPLHLPDTPDKDVKDIHWFLTPKKGVNPTHLLDTPGKGVKGIYPVNTCSKGVDILHQANTPTKLLREELVNLLNRYNWDWFTTLTFNFSPSSYTALRKVNTWLRTLQRKEKRHIGYYITQEKTKLGCPHFHLLMGNLTGVNRKKYWQLWFEKNGRARILPYDPKKGACHYLTKYVIKDIFRNNDTWDIQGLEYLNQLTLDKKK